MTIQTREKLRSLKWVVAVIVFILAMTITWADVHGIPTGQAEKHQQVSQSDDQSVDRTKTSGSQGVADEDDPPSSIPEPMTWILLGSGLSAMYVLRRRNRAR